MKKLTTFKTIAKNKETGKYSIIVEQDTTKTNFIQNLRGNGYRVNNLKVKEENLYNWIINNPIELDNEYITTAQWKLNKIPETAEEYYNEMIKNLQKIMKTDKKSIEITYGTQLKWETEWVDY